MIINILYAATFSYLNKIKILGIIFISALSLIFVAIKSGEINFGYQWVMWGVGFARVSFSFFVGVLIARYLRDGALPIFRMPSWALVLITFASLSLPDLLGGWKDLGCILVLFPLMCIAAVQNQPKNVALYTFLGLISYPLYVIHLPLLKIIYTASAKLTGAPIDASAPWLGLSMVAMLVVCAWLLARWYDPAARKVLRMVLLHRRKPSARQTA